MKTIKVNRNIRKSIEMAEEQIMNGYEVVFDFGTSKDFEKVEKMLTYLGDDYGVDIYIRHAELKEIIEGGIIGGVAGAGIGIIAAFYFSGPVGWIALSGMLIGAAAGSISKSLIVTVYKRKGVTYMKVKTA
ncbi:MAG: hypothetical protein JSS91_07585 [Bacteroidetes bacterium]|nr:hypothetical protein [Bacteroidota bacterium]